MRLKPVMAKSTIAMAYFMMTTCRQTSRLLLCYGVRCAHLHLKHCMQELPGLYAACREVVDKPAACL